MELLPTERVRTIYGILLDVANAERCLATEVVGLGSFVLESILYGYLCEDQHLASRPLDDHI